MKGLSVMLGLLATAFAGCEGKSPVPNAGEAQAADLEANGASFTVPKAPPKKSGEWMFDKDRGNPLEQPAQRANFSR